MPLLIYYYPHLILVKHCHKRTIAKLKPNNVVTAIYSNIHQRQFVKCVDSRL